MELIREIGVHNLHKANGPDGLFPFFRSIGRVIASDSRKPRG